MRSALKSAARALASVAVFPLVLWYWCWSAVLGRDQTLEGCTELLSLWPGLSGRYLRRAFLAWAIAECHPSASIGFGTVFSKASARVGENVYVGPRCHIGYALIERDVLIAAGVHVTSGARMHGIAELGRPIREQAGEYVAVRIGAGSWVGSAAVVMADVGEGTVVGAGAVVARPLGPFVIAGGVPAEVIRERMAERVLEHA